MKVREAICVVGAGPAGLAAAKRLRERGLTVELLERARDVGGVWRYGEEGSSVYASAHLISSKRMTQFPDFPMPKHYPPYLHHTQALEYLRSYARHFGLYDCAQFGSAVERIERAEGPDEAWRVRLVGGAERIYRGVVAATGHHWDPLWPEIPGAFSGRLLHACQYKTPEVLAGQRVLVIGGGNSGCDLAVEAAQHAQLARQSFRRGYHFLPKFLFGGPLDAGGEVFHRWGAPAWLRQWVTALLVRIALGRPERYGLPPPAGRLFETHPIVNSQLLYYLGHGRLQVRPAVTEFCGDRVRFADGGEEPFDVVICATGYRVSFPFLDPSLVLDEAGRPRLYLQAFHPQHDRFFVAGLLQPNGAIWPLVDAQAQLIAAFLQAQAEGAPAAERFRKEKARGWRPLSGGYRYDASPRHRLEVEFFAYRTAVERLLRGFPAAAGAQAPQG